MTLVVIAGSPGSSTTFSPGFSDLSTVFLIGGLPCTTSGAVWLTTFRCVGVPYRPTVSESELTNVRSRSQWPVSLTKRRSTSG